MNPTDVTVPDVMVMEPGAQAPAENRVAGWGGGIEASPTPPALLVESILFVADRPVAVADLAQVLGTDRRAIEQALGEIARACDTRGVRLQRAGGQVQLVSAPEAAEAIQRFLGLESSTRLSAAALEALSIIAYRQPVTRPEIEDLRGVNSDGVLRTLLMRGLVAPVGRRETVGHPVEYGTTFQFLEYFGLRGLGDLPPLASLVDPEDPDAGAGSEAPDGGGNPNEVASAQPGEIATPLANGHAMANANGVAKGPANGHVNGHSKAVPDPHAHPEAEAAATLG